MWLNEEIPTAMLQNLVESLSRKFEIIIPEKGDQFKQTGRIDVGICSYVQPQER